MGLLKSLLTLWVWEETRQTWTMISKIKALVCLELSFLGTVLLLLLKMIHKYDEKFIFLMITFYSQNLIIT